MAASAEEPRLSYERILNDLSRIIKTDSITSSCLHSKFFVVGTAYGRIHVFDHQGNKVDKQELCVHLKSVNCIDIDAKGEYLVSCSNDRLVVYGLCNSEHNFVLMPDKPIHCVAIDPQFYKPGSGRKFAAGDDRLVLYERGIFNRYKSTIIQTREQRVRNISWQGQFIAWATDLSVQIYDIEQRAVITKIKRDTDLELYQANDQCQFSWRDRRTLLVGWNNSVKVCVIKERTHEVLRELPKKYVEIVSMFETDFTVCGLAPFGEHMIVLSVDSAKLAMVANDSYSLSCNSSIKSGHSSSIASTSDAGPSYFNSISNTNNATAQDAASQMETSNSSNLSDDDLIRPQVHILETFPNEYDELSKDILTPNGINSLSQTGRNLLKSCRFPYTLLTLHRDGIYFIVCPKDVISAKPRDYDDHVEWLIQRSMLRECCAFASEHANHLTRHTLREIEQLYKKDLLDRRTPEGYSEAGRICASICANDLEAWNKAIYEFQDLGQLKHLLPHLPCKLDGFHLDQDSYNNILNDFLVTDSVSFFKAIKEIPCQLYSLQTITDRVIRSLANDPKNLVLNEALAELYTKMGRFEDSVNIYLDFNDKTKIFSLIRTHNLVSILRDKVDRLMQIDADETSQLLVENLDSIPMKDVVERLESFRWEKYLVSYLHRLVKRDPDSCIEYHDLLVKLYAQHQRESLLNFLKISTNYRLEEALEICKEFNLIKEVVFLLGRMGDLKIALQYITESQGDINEAIEFCKEHQDPELWHDLILYSVDKPEFIAALLTNIGAHISDPIELIDRIPVNCEIENLMPSLVKILQDYQLQVSLEQSCRDLMAKDCFCLLEKQVRCQTQGISVREDQLCDHCNQTLLNESLVDNRSSISSLPTPGTSNIRNGIGGLSVNPAGTNNSLSSNATNDIVVFGCHHVFHAECCAAAQDDYDSNNLASKTLTCRVCMLEDGLS